MFHLRASLRPTLARTLVSGCLCLSQQKTWAPEAHGPCGPANSAETGVSRSVCAPSLYTL